MQSCGAIGSTAAGRFTTLTESTGNVASAEDGLMRRRMVDKKPTKEWWAWYLAPPIDYRKVYGNALEFDALDHYYQAIYEQKLKEKK